MIATNPPVFVEHPKTQTVSEGASALLTVVADGFRPFGYQWRFNGADLPGQIGPMLGQTNLTTDQDGFYSVVVSNWSGMATSDVARLYIVQSENPPTLAPLRLSASNCLEVALNGERGRFYRIETSTDLVSWSPEKIFLSGSYCGGYYDPLYTSVFFNENDSALVSIPALPSQKYVRASRYVPQNEVCNLYLKQSRFARILYARDHGQPPGYWPAGDDIALYWPAYIAPGFTCPLGGHYGNGCTPCYDNVPTCTIPGHVLEEPPE